MIDITAAGHLALMRQLLLDAAESPASAVYRYIRAVVPNMAHEHALQLAACLIGSTAAMLEQAIQDEAPDARRLAAGMVACILPVGAELMAESMTV